MVVQGEQFTIQGNSISDLCAEYGTPLYIYDSEVVARQYAKLKSVFNVEKLSINYACKALTNISILRLMHSLGSGIDAVSIGEIHLALKAGFDPNQIVFTPSSVASSELSAAKKLGVRITLDNLDAIRYWGVHHPGIPVALRINPGVKAGGNEKISVGHSDSKFGIPIRYLEKVRLHLKENNVKVIGLHMHTGSDILDVSLFLQATDILFEVAHTFQNLEYLDFGSGFKVPYHPNDATTDIDLFGREVSAKFNEFCAKEGRQLELMIEPGKYLVSDAGTFVVRVNAIKQAINTIFAGVNSGLNHFIRPMFYDSYHEIVNVSNPNDTLEDYSVVGYICETDTFAWNRAISKIRPGDLLAFRNAGAYCFMMASNYNSRLLPAEVLVHEGIPYLIRRRQELEDLFRDLTDPEIHWRG